MTILVAGAGGFLGGHLVQRLVAQDHEIRAVDLKPFDEWYQRSSKVQELTLDLGDRDHCRTVMEGVDTVYNFAGDLGGMGFLATNKAACMRAVVINTNLIEAARLAEVGCYFYASSAAVYPQGKQSKLEVRRLKESDAYPADPEDGYGWEKLFSERMCRHYSEDYGLNVRIARFHNIYGPYGAWTGGREKAPAAICRKVAEVATGKADAIWIWGDGRQLRSFTWIDDAIEGVARLMVTQYQRPVNIGSDEMISINELVAMVERIAEVEAPWVHELNAPVGVRARCSDNQLIQKLMGWQPNTPLDVGMQSLYDWVFDQVSA